MPAISTIGATNNFVTVAQWLNIISCLLVVAINRRCGTNLSFFCSKCFYVYQVILLAYFIKSSMINIQSIYKWFMSHNNIYEESNVFKNKIVTTCFVLKLCLFFRSLLFIPDQKLALTFRALSGCCLCFQYLRSFFVFL